MGEDTAGSGKGVGDRLKAARDAAGLSTRAVARKLSLLRISVSHVTIGNYERGKTFPAMETLRALAGIYARPVDWFLGSTSMLSGVRYRALTSVRVRDKRAYEGDALALLDTYLELENVVERPLEALAFTAAPEETGRALAERLREELELGTQPVASVIDVAEKLGIRVIELGTEARIDGFAAHLGPHKIVVLNSELSNDRIRFNAAHEVGHHLFEDCEEDGEVAFEEKELDKRAHEFASHLLLPESVLEQAIETKSMVRLVQFKERFGISLAAMVYRARSGGHISQRMYERLFRQFSQLGWRKNEPGYVAPDRPARLEALIDVAVHEGHLSFGQVAQLACVPESEIRRRVLRAMGGGSEEEERQEGSGPFKFPRTGGAGLTES